MILDTKKIFFVGIGGAGVSALVRFFKSRGAFVSGSDVSESSTVKELRKEGISISIGQSLNLIPPDTELVVYTNALKKYEPEFLENLSQQFKSLSYPEALGEVSRGMITIAVAGTHGKTSTTGMVARVLLDCKKDPTVILGGLLLPERTNFISGKSEYLIIEADEYVRAFLAYYPKVLVITNVGLDHLDYYSDIADIQSAFRELALRVPPDGAIICAANDPGVAPVLEGVQGKIIDYTEIKIDGLQVPGAHNRLNAKAAKAVGQYLEISEEEIDKALASFVGTGRRFEYKGVTKGGALVFDDYAHNPDKVRAAIQGAREKFPDKKITVVFQPHLFSRTKKLFSELTTAFDQADNVIVTPIFASREHDDGSITHQELADAIRLYRGEAYAASDFREAKEIIMKAAKNDDVILTVGAGDITLLSDMLLDGSLTETST